MDPDEVASAVIAGWDAPAGGIADEGTGENVPDLGMLSSLISIAFQASLLREEGRPVTFRVILRGPQWFSETAGPPSGLLRLSFDQSRPFTAQELRRLTPAVDFDRSLVGVHLDEHRQLRIWGLVHSGRGWLEHFYGGRHNDATILPKCLIVGVRDPGYMVVSQGPRPLCALEGGALQANRLNVFTSDWLTERFAAFRNELLELHEAAKVERRAEWAPIDPAFTRLVAFQMIQRLISTVQRSRHGGTLIVVPDDRAFAMTHGNPWIKLKYRFRDEEPRARFRTLLVRAMNTLAASGGSPHGNRRTMGWNDYGSGAYDTFGDLDEATFEMAHMLATLTAVDGAVVMTRRFELLGFGGEIAGALAEVPFVAKALDLEGTRFSLESTEEVGTRHRSVYRLCNVLQGDVLAIVISQDGSARFIRWKDSQVMYWNHNTVTPPA